MQEPAAGMGRRGRLASPTTALVVGAFVVVLLAALLPIL